MRIKRNEQQVYLLETALAIAVILLASFLYSFTPSLKSYYMAAVLGVLLIVAIIRFGFHRDKHYLKNYVSRIVIACLMVTFIVSFGLGLFLNFTHSSFSLNPHVILSGFLPALLISCEAEVFQYVIFHSYFRNLRPIAIYFAFMLLLFISVLSHAGILIGSFGLFFIGAILVLSGYKISNHYFALSIIETATVVGFLLFTYFAFARIDYLFILFGIVAIILVLIINKANIYVFTKKGREEYKKVRIFKKFIKNYSLIKNRDIDGVIVYDDYLVYASALGIMSTVTEKISQNLVNYNTILY